MRELREWQLPITTMMLQKSTPNSLGDKLLLIYVRSTASRLGSCAILAEGGCDCLWASSEEEELGRSRVL